ncbi:MAG TPA: hypothetical protein VH351_22620 [Bryobacteraceae bacterium]|jgi:hypothetical protein|nr:hypothetical protein [Bryobacteraceae bacterium]
MTAGDLRIQALEDNAGGDVVHHDEAFRAGREILRESSCNASPAIVSHNRSR